MADADDPLAEIEQLIDQFTVAGGSKPPIDLYDSPDEFVVAADLPGRSADRIDVSLTDDRTLRIVADAPDGPDVDGRQVVRERGSRTLDRSVTLPAAVDPEETTARYDRGVLTVELAKQSGSNDGTEITIE